MIKKIVHLADLHFKVSDKTHDEYREILSDMIVDIKSKLENINHNEARIALMGDIFHSKLIISNEQQQIIAWFFNEMTKIAPVILICGNHDTLESNKDRLDSLSNIINLMNNPDITYLDQALEYKSGYKVDDNIIWCHYSIFDEYKRPDIEAARELFPHKKFVGTFHFPLIGSVNDIGYAMENGQFLDIFHNLDFVIGGDIHKHQVLENDGIKIVYPSSTIQQTQGETVRGHYWLLWDVDTNDFEKYEVKSDYGIYKFKITSTTDFEENKEELANY